MGLTWAMIQVLLIMGLLLAATIWIYRKNQQAQFSPKERQGELQVKDGMSLGQGASTFLVDAKGREYLVVVNQHAISMKEIHSNPFEELQDESEVE